MEQDVPIRLAAGERTSAAGLESSRLAYQATAVALYVWAGLFHHLQPGASVPEHYREPLSAVDPAPPLPPWLAQYLVQSAQQIIVPLLARHGPTGTDAAAVEWCRTRFQDTGQALYLWTAILALLEADPGAALPAWIAAELFRIARDLMDHMAGRDFAKRPHGSDVEALLAWQAAQAEPSRATSEDLLVAFGFPPARGRGAFLQVHAHLVAAELPGGWQATEEPPKMARLAILAALGFPVQQGPNPFARLHAHLRGNDAAFAYDRAGQQGGSGIEAAMQVLGLKHHAENAGRHIKAARRRGRR